VHTRNYLDQLDNLGDVSSVLDFMDTDEEVSWAFIEGADTYETHSSIQDAVMTTLLDFVEVATDVRVVTPNVVAGYADRFYEMGISGRNATFEMIIPPEVHAWFHSTYPSISTDVLNDRMSMSCVRPSRFRTGSRFSITTAQGSPSSQSKASLA